MRCQDNKITPSSNADTEEDFLLLENFEKNLDFLILPNLFQKKNNEDLNFYDQIRKSYKSKAENSKKIIYKPAEEIEKFLENKLWINILNQ